MIIPEKTNEVLLLIKAVYRWGFAHDHWLLTGFYQQQSAIINNNPPNKGWYCNGYWHLSTIDTTGKYQLDKPLIGGNTLALLWTLASFCGPRVAFSTKANWFQDGKIISTTWLLHTRIPCYELVLFMKGSLLLATAVDSMVRKSMCSTTLTARWGEVAVRCNGRSMAHIKLPDEFVHQWYHVFLHMQLKKTQTMHVFIYNHAYHTEPLLKPVFTCNII